MRAQSQITAQGDTEQQRDTPTERQRELVRVRATTNKTYKQNAEEADATTQREPADEKRGSVTVRRNGMVFIRTPGPKDQCTQNLRGLLAFHCLGATERPTISSSLACPCGQGQTYGECCFPSVSMDPECGSALCVNPLHMWVGRAADRAAAVEHGDVPVLPACPSCAVCDWTPFGFYATARIRGHHETACANPLRLDAAGRAMLQQWQHEAIEDQISRTTAAGAFEDTRYARLHLLSQNKTQ
jgi:hypothetical protein